MAQTASKGNGTYAAPYGGAYADPSRGRPSDPDKAHGKHGATAHAGEHEGPEQNINTVERALSVAAGGALAAYGLKRKDWIGAAAGVVAGFLVERGVTGHCVAYDALGLTSVPDDGEGAALPHHEEGVTRQRGGAATVDAKSAQKIEQAYTIFGRTPDELYAYWRRLEHLPRIFKHLESVRELDARRSHWVARAPAKQTVEWDAEIVNDVRGQTIAWKSLPGASVPNAGAVNFREAPGGRGTEIRVTLEYEPPAGKLGVVVAKLFGEEPNIQVREDLRRYKSLLEAGELPVSANPGQGGPARGEFNAQVNENRTDAADLREFQAEAVKNAHHPKHVPSPSDAARGVNTTDKPDTTGVRR